MIRSKMVSINIPEHIYVLAQKHFGVDSPQQAIMDEVLWPWACNVEVEIYAKEKSSKSPMQEAPKEATQDSEALLNKTKDSLLAAGLSILESPIIRKKMAITKAQICCPLCEQEQDDPEPLKVGVFARFVCRDEKSRNLPLCLEHAPLVKRLYVNEMKKEDA